MNITFSGKHRNRVNRKLIILAVVLVAVIGLNVFMFATKGPKFKKPGSNSSPDQKKIDSVVQALATEKESLRSLATGLGINALSREAEFSRTDISFYLYNHISALAEKKKVDLLSFSPAGREEKDGLTRISFLGEINSPYAEMVDFFRELEQTERLLINEITITSAPDSPLSHRAQFVASCFALNDELLKNIMLTASPPPLSPTQGEDRVEALARDPFFQELEAAATALPGKDRGAAGPGEASIGLTLTGIIGYPVPHAALINHEVVRVGDKIQGKEVREIKRDEVVLQSGDQVQRVRLSEPRPPSPREENPLSPSDSEAQR